MPKAGFKFDIDISPSPTVFITEMELLGNEIRSFREPLKRVVQKVMAPSFRENFESEGRPSWAPLAALTLAKKAAKGAPPDILVESGKLKKVAGQLNIWKIEGGYGGGNAEAYVSQFPGAEYGQYHQSGTSKMPARPFAVFQEDDIDQIEQVFNDWLGERLRARGF